MPPTTRGTTRKSPPMTRSKARGTKRKEPPASPSESESSDDDYEIMEDVYEEEKAVSPHFDDDYLLSDIEIESESDDGPEMERLVKEYKQQKKQDKKAREAEAEERLKKFNKIVEKFETMNIVDKGTLKREKNNIKKLLPDNVDDEIYKGYDRYGAGLIHIASKRNTPEHIEIINLLIEKGADVNMKDGDGNTPLHIAVDRGHIDIAKELLKRGADINAQNIHNGRSRGARFGQPLRMWNGNTPLHLASISKKVKMVKLLLNAGADITIENSSGYTPADATESKQIKKLLDEALRTLRPKQMLSLMMGDIDPNSSIYRGFFSNPRADPKSLIHVKEFLGLPSYNLSSIQSQYSLNSLRSQGL